MASGSRRIGLLGGTFDPPHLGHVTVAADVADALGLDGVLWIPAAVPPHKQDQTITPGPLRLAMVEAACAIDPRFAASAVELERAGISYTVDTLRALREESPEVDWVLILGVDQFRTMATGWKEPEQVLSLATVAVMDRDGTHAREAVPDVRGASEAIFVPVTRVDISSTQVRQTVAAGGDVSAQVPAPVLTIIEREGLYRG